MSPRCSEPGCVYPASTSCAMAGCPGRSFKIADWPLHERPDVWTWGDGVRLAESARAELGVDYGDTATVTASGRDILIDRQDLAVMDNYWLYLGRTKSTCFVKLRAKDRSHNLRLAKWIMKPEVGLLVDHINGNPLDNRRCNLRVVTPAGNNWNRAKCGERPTSSQFKGVSRTASGKWFACLGLNYKRINLGLFQDERAAAEAYDEAARRLFGECAALNFPKAGEQSAHRRRTVTFHGDRYV